MSETTVIEGRVEKVNMTSKLPGIKLVDNPAWFNRSKDEYLQAPFDMPQVGQFVRMMVSGSFAVGCEILPAFEGAPVQAPNVGYQPTATPIFVDPTRKSIERQVALKCATELMVAILSKPNTVPDRGVEVAAEVAAMAMAMAVAIEAE